VHRLETIPQPCSLVWLILENTALKQINACQWKVWKVADSNFCTYTKLVYFRS